MGVDPATLRFLILASQTGVRFDRTLTLGRQNLNVAAWELNFALRDLGIPSSEASQICESQPYAESFYRWLGAQDVDAMDASDYEGATVVHSLNDPIPDTLSGRFSLVHDGGTLEHVFDVRTAWSNAMQMVEVGGHFIGVTTANNHLGHGFFQFSPELLFRVFSPENGFELEGVFLYEQTSRGYDRSEVYEVRDPALLGRRVVLVNAHPTLILCRARRTSEVAPFVCAPCQSDYVAQWRAPGDRARSKRSNPYREYFRQVRFSLKRKLRIVDQLRHGIESARSPAQFDHAAYQKWTLDASMRMRWDSS